MRASTRHDAALEQILDLVVLLTDDMTRSLARAGLTVSRAHVLWELRQRGPTVQRTLAEAMNVSARTITGLVDGLVTTGFVTREPHPADRRATLVTFTAHGATTAAAMRRDQDQLASLLFEQMPDAQFDCLIAGLGGVLTKLRERGRSSDMSEDDP